MIHLAWLLFTALPAAPPVSAHAPAAPFPVFAVGRSGQASPPQVAGKPNTPPAPPQRAFAEAYSLFLQARERENDGDVEGAIKLYGDARRLDPTAAEIPAELSALYARQNRAREAIEAADVALTLDPDNVEAHFVLGSIYAAFAETDRPAPTAADRQAARQYAAMAVPHLEAAWRVRGNTASQALLMTLAHMYLAVRTPQKAIAPLQRAIEQDPEALDAVTMLADAYVASGRSADAITLLAQVADREPSLYASLAQLYEDGGRWKEAAEAYRKAVELGTDAPGIRTRWATALLNTQQPADRARARDLLQAVVARTPTDLRALDLLSQAQRQSNELGQAEATARALIAADPGGASGPYALAQVYAQQHQYEKVVEMLQPLVDRFSAGGGEAARIADLTPLLMHLGFAYLDLNQPDKAMAALERAKALGAGESVIDVALVQAQIAAKRFALAADLAAKARQAFPDDVRLPRLQADALRQDGKMDRAVAVLEAVRKARPGDVATHIALAELLMSGGRAAQAVSVLRQAQEAFPDDLDVTFELGAACERQKRYDAAEQAFRKVIARAPHHAQALNYLGYMLADRGIRLPESVEYIRRALQADPGNPAYLDSLGWAYFRMNRLDLAEANLREAASARVGDSAVQEHWGDLLFKLGRIADAIVAWQRALDGDGDSIDRAAIERKLRSARRKAGKQ